MNFYLVSSSGIYNGVVAATSPEDAREIIRDIITQMNAENPSIRFPPFSGQYRRYMNSPWISANPPPRLPPATPISQQDVDEWVIQDLRDLVINSTNPLIITDGW